MDALAISSADEPQAPELTPVPNFSDCGKIRPFDWIAGGFVFSVMIVLRVLYIHALHWHSDEPQHMHVVWGWANGFLPYRDVFDNHSPLFGFLFSPLFRLVGERNDIVDAMRWFMLPLFAVSLWSIYRLGAIAFASRVGFWGAIVGGLYPNWFLKMAEFRTDVLWTTLWLVTLVVLVSGRVTAKRMFFAGLVLGATFSVSMKSTLMLLTLCAAALLTWIILRFFVRPKSGEPTLAKWLPLIAAGLCGLIVIPGAFITFFVANGVGEKMYYCVIQHNITGSHSPLRILRRFLTWQSIFIPISIGLGLAMLPSLRSDPARVSRRLFLLCVAGVFSPILEAVWTNVTSQDYMPVWPLFGAIAAVLFIMGGDWLARRFPGARWIGYVLLCLLVAFEFQWIYRGGFRFHRDADEPVPAPISLLGRPNQPNIEVIKEARALTEPGEYLMDSKGETIYRQRPYWYVLETLTRKRLYAGTLPDELPQRLIDTRTAVTTNSNRMMAGSQKFIADNYVSVGYLNVLGHLLPEGAGGVYEFDIVIPAAYTFITRAGTPPSGDLDGVAFSGPVELQAGHHVFKRDSGKGTIAVVWARAIEKGYSPFRSPVLSP